MGIWNWIKANKRICFCILALAIKLANMAGFAEYQLDPNIEIVFFAVVTLILSLLRKYKNI